MNDVTHTLPTLYKRSSKGALQEWTISHFGAVITTQHGQVGGKLQIGLDTIKSGKNIGRANETTVEQQAALEAQAKWTKKKEREGYVEERERAEAGEDDAEGGIKPMLAKTLEDVDISDEFLNGGGVDAQRKLNGIRCIVVKDENGEVGLWSRKRKRILGVPHVLDAYKRALAGVTGPVVLDGELYRHGWSLQKISGYVRKEKTKPGFEQLSHHLYDFPSIDDKWTHRRVELEAFYYSYLSSEKSIKLVETVSLNTASEIDIVHDAFVREGHEGLMVRVRSGKYKPGSRSSDLLKVKKWKDAEFKITAVNEGRGKFEGKAVFTCVTDEGKEFDCCAPGNMEDRAEFLRRGAELLGKLLTVKFFEWTDDKKPCFPVGMAVRDYE